MGMLKEFRDFAVKGNVADMAVGIIIGAAFGKIVSSLVNDILMPPIGMLLGNMDFSELRIPLGKSANGDPVTLNYGLFINNVLDFVIVAFAIFFVIRQMNRLQGRGKEPPQDPTTKACPHCCSTIPIKATRCPNCTSELGT